MNSGDVDVGARPSRDGHEFHVAWAARVSLELLHPNAELKAISLEGFPTEDASGFSDEAMEIADLVKFYGGSSVKRAKQISVVQLKYSPVNKNKDLTASDLSKTLKKFSDTKKDLEKILGKKHASNVTSFEFVSNRPVGDNLKEAISALATGGDVSGHVQTQAATLKEACSLKDKELKSFLERLTITGEGSSLKGLKSSVHRTIADWSSADDPVARLRLHDLCEDIRDKAGMSGAFNNTISYIDVLGSFGTDEDNLFPTPHSFPKVEVVLERPFLTDLIETVLDATRPFIIHGDGGIGKTVVMQSLANSLSKKHVTILFDGFGGGNWRSPGDDRHLCKRSLLHIINSLATNGLCDLMLPSDDEGGLLRTAHKRLRQASKFVRGQNPTAQIILLLDAIDHAGIRAEETNTNSFAKLLLEKFDIESIEGVKVVASCRTGRRKKAYGSHDFPHFKIPVFSREECQSLVAKRIPDGTTEELSILISRSGRNPRCLDILIEDGRPFDQSPETNKKKLLDQLIEKRFARAIANLKEKGTSDLTAKQIIAGLRLLPPPVPVDELAATYDIDTSEVESFFTDLFPLIDRTPKGLVFKDEPTETLAQKYIDDEPKSSDAVFERLLSLQSNSSYAARALPSLLVQYDRVDALITLARSDVFPDEASSSVAVRNIQLSRISAALILCTKFKRRDDIFELMMEAAFVAGGSQRSDQYVLDFADVAAISGDSEAVRRLFETDISWTGANHSARALANAIEDNADEARRDASKAIDWLNWGQQQIDEDQPGRRSRTQSKDWTGALYVHLLTGGDESIIKWLGQRSANDAYQFFSMLLGISIRHAKQSDLTAQFVERYIEKACSGELEEPWVLASILDTLPCSKSQEKKIIKQLAAQITPFGKSERDAWDSKYKRYLNDALLSIVIMGIRNKLKREAQEILICIDLTRPREYDYRGDMFYGTRVPQWLVYSTLNSIFERRMPSLADFVPGELWDELPISAKNRGPKEIENSIQRVLGTTHNQMPRRKRKKTRLSSESLRELDTCLSHRIKPILPYAIMFRKFVTKSPRESDVESYIDLLTQNIDKSSTHPYRSQKQYIAAVGFGPIVRHANALDLWTTDSALTVAKWLSKTPIFTYSFLTEVAESFTLVSETHKAALKLIHHIVSIVKKDDQIDVRIQQFGDLARTIWRVSRNEASGLFKEGLEIADAIGAENYDEIQSLVHMAAEYAGPTLKPRIAHDFARICELNFSYEAEKFIWVGYGEALARIGGSSSLGIISRLADKDKVDLRYPLLPMLAALVKHDHLSADLAASIMGLDKVFETWGWDMHHFAGTTLPKLSKRHKGLFACWITTEYDREYEEAPPSDVLEKLVAVFQTSSVPHEVYSHLNGIQERNKSSEKQEVAKELRAYRGSEEKKKNRPIKFDVADVLALENDIQVELSNDEGHFVGAHRLKEIILNIDDADQLVSCLTSISQLELLSLEEKLYAFEHAEKIWGDDLKSLKGALETAVITAVKMHAIELTGSDWHISSVMRDVLQFCGGKRRQLLLTIVKSLQGNFETLDRNDWLRIASYFAPICSSESVGSGISRFVEQISTVLPDENLDQPWSDVFSQPRVSEEVVAGFLWHQLGSPYSELRWRAVHAILRLSNVNRFDVIELLVDKLDAECSGVFGDSRLPFYYLHARLWLLIALVRISKERPQDVAAFRSEIERCIQLNDKHISICHHGYSFLINLERYEEKSGFEKRVSKFQGLIGPISTDKWPDDFMRGDSYARRLGGGLEPAETFHFEYDFNKYDIDSLGRLFGVHTWQVADDMSEIISNIDPSVSNMYDCPRGIGGDSDYRNDHKYQQRYGYYLAYHALLISAGQYIHEKPVLSYSEDEDPWSYWIAEYTEQSPWLSELTELFPISQPHIDVDFEKDKEAKTTMAERSELAKLCGVDDSTYGNNFVVSGSWRNANGVDIRISSCLVRPGDLTNVTRSIFVKDPFFQYLPTESTDYYFTRKAERNPVREWISSNQSETERVDETDPYGCKTALSRRFPNEGITSLLGLRMDDEDGRTWSGASGNVAFTSKVWGARHGTGRHASENSGQWLLCDRGILQELLKRTNEALVILITGQKYHTEHRGEGKFVTKTSLVTISKSGQVRIVQKIPKKVKDVVAEMPHGDKQDFKTLYQLMCALN